jgi:hypothetical protein
MFYSFLFLAMNKEQQHNLYIILQFIRITVFVTSSRNTKTENLCVLKSFVSMVATLTILKQEREK